eukprot:3303453-Amphidinium_carterae.1
MVNTNDIDFKRTRRRPAAHQHRPGSLLVPQFHAHSLPGDVVLYTDGGLRDQRGSCAAAVLANGQVTLAAISVGQ